ncbi:MAG: anthranilate phosphoribosyltransferase [Gammaproteobacteria bacterium]|nr:anthranilate phosphoribosyltransferase [Gammaproteobacteria bacterium]
MNIQQAIKAVTEKQDLSRDDMTDVMRQIMTGEATDSQIGGFLIGLRMKGETVDEITAAASVMRELSTKVETSADYLVDTCGTGGDASGSFNISTASAIVTAAAGAHVAKHGNRSVSSKSGSADVLEAAGVNLDVTPEQVAQCIESAGVGFLFAQKHHSAMRFAITARKEMAVRTIFNVLGPLTNPASAPNQVMGVFAKDLVTPIAHVLKELGSRHVMVVHSDDGMDEISISAATTIAELKDGEVSTYQVKPEDFGMKSASIIDLKVDSAEQSLAMIQSVLDNKSGPANDIVCLNAGAAIYVAGLADSHQQGVKIAQAALSEGKAQHVLNKLIKESQVA